MNLRQAAEMALAALVWEVGSCPEMYAKQTAEAITALRAALAETDEPVAWMDADGNTISHAIKVTLLPTFAALYPVPLYTHPPRREPLTDLTKGATWEQQK